MIRPLPLAALAAMAALAALLLAGSAAAHGPTVRVAYSGVKPPKLVITTGTTVHFHNANSSAGVCTVVAEDGSFESPPLARAEGWHHTFEKAGTYSFRISEFGSSTGTIVVADP